MHRLTISARLYCCCHHQHQGDREKNENLPVSPNMDRDTTHQSELSINFIDFIVAPFFIGLSGLLPRVRECCEQLSSNRNNWDTMNTKRDRKSTRLNSSH